MPRLKVYDDLRSIRRWLVFKRGLELYNKRYNDKLNKYHVPIMYCLRHNNRVGKLTSSNTLYDWMYLMRMRINIVEVRKHLRYLVDTGYVERTGNYLFLTPEGATALQDLERTLKKQRIDR